MFIESKTATAVMPSAAIKTEGIPSSYAGKTVTLVVPEHLSLQEDQFPASGLLPGQHLKVRTFLSRKGGREVRVSCYDRVELKATHQPVFQLQTSRYSIQQHKLTEQELAFITNLEYRLVVDRESVRRRMEKSLAAAEQQKLGQSATLGKYEVKFESVLNAFLLAEQIPANFPVKITSESRLEQDGLAYGMALTIGGRTYQEDSCCYQHLKNEQVSLENCHLFAVFDGHGEKGGGQKCSAQAAKILPTILARHLCHYRTLLHREVADFNALKIAFTETDITLRNDASCGQTNGTTACAVLVENGVLLTANTGDCRALLVDGDRSIQLCSDMRANDPNLESSIDKRCGMVGYSPLDSEGPIRVGGFLEPARTLGDGQMHGVSPRPKITRYPLPSGITPLTLVIASDGIFGNATSEQIGALVAKMRTMGKSEQQIAELIVRLSLEASRLFAQEQGGAFNKHTDNMMVQVVFLDGQGHPEA